MPFDIMRWIMECVDRGEGFLVIAVDDVQHWVMFGKNYKYYEGQFNGENYVPFAGVHEKNIHLFMNWDNQPVYVQNQMHSLLTSKNAGLSLYPS